MTQTIKEKQKFVNFSKPKASFVSNEVVNGMIILRRNKHDKSAHASATISHETDILKLEVCVLECKTRSNDKDNIVLKW